MNKNQISDWRNILYFRQNKSISTLVSWTKIVCSGIFQYFLQVVELFLITQNMRLKISFASLSLDNKKRKTRYKINHFIYFSLATTELHYKFVWYFSRIIYLIANIWNGWLVNLYLHYKSCAIKPFTLKFRSYMLLNAAWTSWVNCE